MHQGNRIALSPGVRSCAAAPVMGPRRKPVDILEKYWGYSKFRFCQEQVINTILSGTDCLVVMPTGGGKSICYQIPPLVLDRVCIVISPLISLMEDQVAALNARHISATFLGSAQISRQVKDDAWRGIYQFVYLTPELAANSGTALTALQARRGIALVAIDEAHCVSEWGHDFRPDYRRLGSLRDCLPGVPLVALTATSTPRVQNDILRNLGMGSTARCFVESFERTNLHFSVRQKTSVGDLAGELKAAARSSRGQVPSTLIYALTTKEVDDIAAHLNLPTVLNGRAGSYHAKRTPKERREAHAAFMRDDLDVLVASVAYGMGIDKPNVRTIIHWGMPASVESYYQQAGRAGRDGAKSRCILLWSAADAITLARIKEEGMSSEGRVKVHEDTAKMQAYCHSTNCRHAHLVNFFTTGALPLQGPCQGGCDMCDRRSSGEVTSRDIAVEARLMLSAVEGLRNQYGLLRSVQLLRGSRSKDLLPWMLQAAHAITKDPLHGSGSSRSESWWKALGGLLCAEGLLQYHSVGGFQVVRVSEKGCRWLRSEQPLEMDLPPALLEEEMRAHREALAKQRQQEERQQALTAEMEELEALRAALREQRKRVADALGHNAPDTLVSDLTLDSLARLRPQELPHLRLVGGMGQVAIEAFGAPLIEVIKSFLATARHLGSGGPTDWIAVARLRSRSDAMAAASSSEAVEGTAATADGGGGGGGSNLGEAAVQAARRLLLPPKGSASEAGAKWQSGMSAVDIATRRDRPIAIATVLGYVADCVGAGLAGDVARLVLEAGLDRNKALAIAAAIKVQAASGIGAVKKFLDSTNQPAEYGQIKVVAALMAVGALWFSSGAVSQEHPAGAGQPQGIYCHAPLPSSPFAASSPHSTSHQPPAATITSAVGGPGSLSAAASYVSSAKGDWVAGGPSNWIGLRIDQRLSNRAGASDVAACTAGLQMNTGLLSPSPYPQTSPGLPKSGDPICQGQTNQGSFVSPIPMQQINPSNACEGGSQYRSVSPLRLSGQFPHQPGLYGMAPEGAPSLTHGSPLQSQPLKQQQFARRQSCNGELPLTAASQVSSARRDDVWGRGVDDMSDAVDATTAGGSSAISCVSSSSLTLGGLCGATNTTATNTAATAATSTAINRLDVECSISAATLTVAPYIYGGTAKVANGLTVGVSSQEFSFGTLPVSESDTPDLLLPMRGPSAQQQQQQPSGSQQSCVCGDGNEAATHRPPVITGKKRSLPAIFGGTQGKRQHSQQQIATVSVAAAPATIPGPAAPVVPVGRHAVLSLLHTSGPLTAVALAQRLYGAAATAAGSKAELQGVLEELVGEFEVVRQGLGSMRSEICMDDTHTTFQIL